MKKIMKSWATLYILLIAMGWCALHPMYKAAATIVATTETVAAQLITEQAEWFTLGSFLSAGDESNDLGVTQRTQSGVQSAIGANANGQGKIIIYGPLPIAANAIRIRNIGLTAAGDHVYNIYTGASEDHNFVYVLRGTLTFKTGSQASAILTYEFADLLTVTNTSASSTSWTVANPGDGSDLVAEAFIDLQGDDMIVIVPTTLDDNSKLLGKFY